MTLSQQASCSRREETGDAPGAATELRPALHYVVRAAYASDGQWWSVPGTLAVASAPSQSK